MHLAIRALSAPPLGPSRLSLYALRPAGVLVMGSETIHACLGLLRRGPLSTLTVRELVNEKQDPTSQPTKALLLEIYQDAVITGSPQADINGYTRAFLSTDIASSSRRRGEEAYTLPRLQNSSKFALTTSNSRHDLLIGLNQLCGHNTERSG